MCVYLISVILPLSISMSPKSFTKDLVKHLEIVTPKSGKQMLLAPLVQTRFQKCTQHTKLHTLYPTCKMSATTQTTVYDLQECQGFAPRMLG